MIYDSLKRTRSRKFWAAFLVFSMVLQFFAPVGIFFKPVPVMAEEETTGISYLDALKALDLTGKGDVGETALPANNREEPVVSFKTGPNNYGAFQNVEHEVILDAGHSELCRRSMAGTITFDWPEPSTHVDVVFIQDQSGSFKNTIQANPYWTPGGETTEQPGVGNAINEMIAALNLKPDLDGSPSDRVMFVGFRASQALAFDRTWLQQLIYVDATSYIPTINNSYPDYTAYGPTNPKNQYRIDIHSLTSSRSQAEDYVDAVYDKGQCIGGTPTIEGLYNARLKYGEYIQSHASENYNRQEYQITYTDGQNEEITLDRL